jgi:hypothetical protein
MATQTLTVRIALSPLQWGEKPGSLRFSIHTTSDQIAIGAFSIGGLPAYQLRGRIVNEAFVSARVICGGRGRFVLTHILSEDSWLPWKQAVAATVKQTAEVLLDDKVILPANRRMATSRTIEVEA